MPTWPSPFDHRLGTPDIPAIRSTRGADFVASLVRFRYGLPSCSPPSMTTRQLNRLFHEAADAAGINATALRPTCCPRIEHGHAFRLLLRCSKAQIKNPYRTQRSALTLIPFRP